MPERVVLHVGTHKTGTSSIQAFLREEDDALLRAAGVHFPPGYLLPGLHADLPLLALRPEFDWPARLRFPETARASWQRAAEAHVRTQVRSSPRSTLVYSHEDLSYARHDDELGRLLDLFEGLPVQVVVVLREPTAYLHSYAAQLSATDFPLSDDPASFAYVEADSWLVDYDALVAGYGRCFGDANVSVLDFDAVVARDGSVLPAFIDLLGIARSALPNLDGYFLNQAGHHLRPTLDQLAEIRRRVAEQHP